MTKLFVIATLGVGAVAAIIVAKHLLSFDLGPLAEKTEDGDWGWNWN